MMFHKNEDDTNNLAIVHMAIEYIQESIFEARQIDLVTDINSTYVW